jgi:CheY-like chemotaxis protein
MTNVVLIEDNEMNRDMLSRRLTKRGYTVVMAIDGQQGIDMSVSEKPDIILLDMSLPVVDGWEAAQQIKANPLSAGVPLIALTAHAMASDKERALSAGCELPRLLAKMETLLKAKGIAPPEKA